MSEIPHGYCHCGCGERTRVSQRNNPQGGYMLGEPVRYLPGHHKKGCWQGENNPKWNNGRCITKDGYLSLNVGIHPRANKHGFVLEHILIAERALGRTLPPGAEIHHHNGINNDNSPGNLVLCDSRAYHKMLHRRARAHKACGHADWFKCSYCQQYDDPKNMWKRLGYYGRAPFYIHRKCRNDYRRKRTQILMSQKINQET